MIKLFEQYNEYSEVKKWLVENFINNYTINDDLTVDVDGDVFLSSCELREIPIQFGNINGYFDISMNSLTSLKGCPYYISGDFSCVKNNLESLEYSPKEVGGTYRISRNPITSLKGCPKVINGNFICDSLHVTSLEDGPKRVLGDYICSYNPITSLKGCPEYVGTNLECVCTNITSLKYAPKYIGNIFTCKDCRELPIELPYYANKPMTYIIKNQDEYGIWNNDGSLNSKRFEILMRDYEDGVLG